MSEVGKDTIPDSIRAEAAQWLARREGDEPDKGDPAFKAWLARDLRHRLAYAEAERMWRESLLLANSRIGQERTLSRAPLYMRRSTHIAVATCAVLLVVGTLSLRFVAGNPVVNIGVAVEARSYQTGPGETRTWRLADGTGLTLVGEGRAETRFDANMRRIELQAGQARIAVAAGDRRTMEVRAGTANVRTRDAELEVQVTATAGRVDVRIGHADAVDGDGTTHPLTPGQGIDTAPKVSGSTASATSVHGDQQLASMRDMTVGEAIALLNQRNTVQLHLAAPAIASKRLSGAFRLDDPDSFARTLALLNDLDVERATGAIELRSR
jgi:transmembrane sensor